MKQIDNYEPAQIVGGTLLNANESSENLPDFIMKEIQDEIVKIAFNRYPDMAETELLEAYAKVIGVKKENLLAGNGSDQMLGYLIGTYLGKGKTLFTLNPDFSMYDYYASGYESEIVKYVQDPDGNWDLDKMMDKAKEIKADMILFSNPNNPSGTVISVEQVEKILNRFPDIPVVIDEAYMDFADDAVTSISMIDQYKNLFVTKTLSKAYGLAGLRVGFLVGNEETMTPLKAAFVPYALNAVSMKIASIVLKYPDFVAERIENTKKERASLYAYASELKSMKVHPSNGNFIKGTCDDKARLLQLFAEEDIAIREYGGTNVFRISIGTAEEMVRVKSVLKKYDEEHV